MRPTPRIYTLEQVGIAAEVKWLPQLKSENTLKGDYIWLKIGAQF